VKVVVDVNDDNVVRVVDEAVNVEVELVTLVKVSVDVMVVGSVTVVDTVEIRVVVMVVGAVKVLVSV